MLARGGQVGAGTETGSKVRCGGARVITEAAPPHESGKGKLPLPAGVLMAGSDAPSQPALGVLGTRTDDRVVFCPASRAPYSFSSFAIDLF